MDGNEFDDDVVRETDAARDIIERMQDDGYSPTLLVFLAADGTSRLWHREGLDAEDFLRFLLAAEVARGARH
ncbi:MAG: hypothetical protein K2X36_06575 [Microbacteriaceae bacterium]|nr:hypothetical protein [Microbacteriaceae bacterium]